MGLTITDPVSIDNETIVTNTSGQIKTANEIGYKLISDLTGSGNFILSDFEADKDYLVNIEITMNAANSYGTLKLNDTNPTFAQKHVIDTASPYDYIVVDTQYYWNPRVITVKKTFKISRLSDGNLYLIEIENILNLQVGGNSATPYLQRMNTGVLSSLNVAMISGSITSYSIKVWELV